MAFGINLTGANTNSSSAKEDKVPAQVWLNIGYLSDVVDENGERRFVSLPFGIALDTMSKVSTNSRNADYAMFQQARNQLLDQLIEVGMALKPGQDTIMELENGLAIQIRRVNEAAAEIPTSGNPYTVPKLFNLPNEAA